MKLINAGSQLVSGWVIVSVGRWVSHLGILVRN